MKKTIVFISIFFVNFCFSQKNKSNKIGQTTINELKLKTYKKDSTANAVVLYEHANLYLDEDNNYKFRTDYYFRIKIFDKKAYDKGNIEIPLYKSEEVKDVKAVTYNLVGDSTKKDFLSQKDIFTDKKNEYWKTTSFTLPNIQEGSVLEFSYSVLSPYPNIDDWYFQSDIPKVKSEFDAAILGNYKYKIRIIGFQELDKNNQSVKKRCVNIDGIGDGACLISSMGMNNIPAFKEEKHMLSKKNFMSRLVFDLISFTEVNGSIRKYTKTWKDADKTLRLKYLDGQTNKKSFFKRNLPEEILLITDPLERAKKTYSFIQKKLNWNGKYWTRKKLRIKKTFKEGSGSVDALNLILYNSLQASEIESYLVAISTRENGLPTKLYPIVNDFNYILVKAVINKKTYYLDVTNKFSPFGLIPFKCINGDGRVLDFKNGSYWEPIKPSIKSSISIRSKAEFDNELNLQGEVQFLKKGYYALEERESINSKTKQQYLEGLDAKNESFLIENYDVTHEKEIEKPLIQQFNITSDEIETDNQDNIRINPFFYGRITKNPFKLNTRNYPVDYGYPRKIIFSTRIKIPKNYKITKLPDAKSVSLPNKGGRFILKTIKTENEVSIYFTYSINKKVYSNLEYHYLKEFYNQIIQTQNSYILLEKKQ